MKGIVLFFEVHQPLRLKRYRFFDMGKDHYYYDDFTNENILRRVANECYLPANRLLLDPSKANPDLSTKIASRAPSIVACLEAI